MSGAVLNSRLLTRLLTSGEEDIEHVSMLKEDISTTVCELTMLIFLEHGVYINMLVSLHFDVLAPKTVFVYITNITVTDCRSQWDGHSSS